MIRTKMFTFRDHQQQKPTFIILKPRLKNEKMLALRFIWEGTSVKSYIIQLPVEFFYFLLF